MNNIQKTIQSLDELVSTALISRPSPDIEAAINKFSTRITPIMANLINPADRNDPIALQFVPSKKELVVQDDELVDPIGDEKNSPVHGVVHRYPDRVLLKLSNVCAVHCRFCFRREQVCQKEKALSLGEVEAALDYVKAHEEIWEVILSGGDPLMLSPKYIAKISCELDNIPHVKVIRIHTRVPVVDPSRITSDLIAALRCSKPVYILIHCNHARELTLQARVACALLVNNGFPLLSQSVLIHGVNDNLGSLCDLMKAFVESRIKPHYLHHCDKALGTGHFRVPLAKGQALLRSMQGVLSGLCQPRYILDIPGGFGKIPIDPVYIVKEGDKWMVNNFQVNHHTYSEDSL